MAITMKEALVDKDTNVSFHDAPIPKPGRNEVLIKIVYSGSNPKDWKLPLYMPGADPNTGDDMAGTIVEVGEGVLEFKPGDRVAAMHAMGQPHGTFAEYGIAPANTTFHLPTATTFEEAATLPLAALTAAVALYRNLELPQPWSPSRKSTPLLIYGGSSAVGAFSIKLAQQSNIHPIIAIAGSSKALVEQLIDPSQGDIVIDYRDDWVAAVKRLGLSINYAFDTICSETSVEQIAGLLAESGHLNVISPPRDCSAVPKTLTTSATYVGDVHGQPFLMDNKSISHRAIGDGEAFGLVYSRLFTRALDEGWLTGHPIRVWPNGLSDLDEALKSMRNGDVSGKKYVFKLSES